MELFLPGKVRKDILDAAYKSGKVGAHIAPSLSVVEICIAILTEYKENDIFVMSKAHGALGYYAVMHQIGMISDFQFASFEQNGGDFPGQPCRTKDNKIDYSGGSLGMGLSYAAGRAWAMRKSRVFVVVGDGELDEGSNWEAASVIAKNRLGNVLVIVDCNGLQSDGKCEDVLDRKLYETWKAMGWDVSECDGHDLISLQALVKYDNENVPRVILAKTIKGKGISFMENNNLWHHSELKKNQYDIAIEELKEKYGLY